MILTLIMLASGVEAEEQPNFSRDVRPILSANCFKCHGPDEGNRQSKLRLDMREAAVGKAEGDVPIIVPGKPDESELIKRILSSDESEVMPPPDTKKHLTKEQIETLKTWVAAGAKYEPHWAFVPPQQTPLPVVKNAKWPRNPIDNFVLAKIEAAGLEPSPEANRYALIRRVYLDLIGIPPTAEEADAFVNDNSPDAYEKRVDSLLKSPQYGERWARRWLDLARYADTNGYEKDRGRSIWPYRDWVINALNADMPFDQFTVEQIAGDLLPNATVQQKVATGFHRNTMLNEEGGIDPLEFRYYAVVDRINTTSTVWLGLTLGCAQCHTHKFDPIQQTEYYQMMSWLNNTEEPDLDVTTPALMSQSETIKAQIAELEKKLADRFPVPETEADKESNKQPDKKKNPKKKVDVALHREAAEQSFAKWLEAQNKEAVTWHILRPSEMNTNKAKLTLLPDGSVLASGDQEKLDTYNLTLPLDLENVTALRLEMIPDPSLPGGGPGRCYYEGTKGGFWLCQFLASTKDGKVTLKNASASHAASDKFGAGAAIDDDIRTAWTYDNQLDKPQQAVFQLSEPLAKANELKLSLISEQYYSVSLGRFRIWATDDKRSVAAKPMPTEIEQLCLIAPDQLKSGEREQLWHYFLSIAPELAPARQEIDNLRGQLPQYPTSLVMRERAPDNPRKTFRHNRGEFLEPKEEVEPGVLSILHKLPSDAPKNRLTFARWLVNEQNPLVGRVTMNREWAAFFGRGIVRTIQDFGYQGEPPTHPELLDWLAIEFIRQKWSIKSMHRMIVTSATYRQASSTNEKIREHDPENRLLAHGPRVRLEAELIRDEILAVSGLLSKKVGGPSVFPPQPKSVGAGESYVHMNWNVSAGEDRYRRGLYTFSKRSAPFAMATTFDAPTGESCVARRDVSNSPLQALTMLNDEVFVEASKKMGQQLSELSSPSEDRMRILFRRCLIRPPSDREITMLIKFYNEQLHRFTSGEAKADGVAGSGNGDTYERAAWTLTARSILNLDEIVTKE